MSSRVKGITIDISGDTTGLNKALEGTNKKIKNTQSQLKDVDKLLKMDPGNTELLEQKQKLLADQIGNTKEKLEKLAGAEKQVQQQMKEGKASQEQYDALRREIIQTEQSLGKLQDSAAETEDALHNAGQNGEDDLHNVKKEADNVADSLDDVADAAEDVDNTGSSFSDVFQAGAAVAGIQAVIDKLKEVSENTKEYRNNLSKLNTAFERNGQTTEVAKQTYDELFAILGDSGQAVEAANNLAMLTDNQEQLAQWTDIAAGVYGTFGDSLPIEGLAEAANETAKTGTLTGNLADALNWVGINEDEFQEKLDKCSSTSSRARQITNTLSDAYKKAGVSFRETNKDVIASNKANGKLQDTFAQLGKKVEPILTTLVTASSKFVDILISAKPVLVSLLAGFAFAKIAKFASALDMATLAQKAFNFAANKNPYILLASLIITAIGLVGEIANALGDAEESVDDLTDAEKDAAAETKRLQEEAYIATQKIGKEVATQSRIAAEKTSAAVDEISGKVKEMQDAFTAAHDTRMNEIEGDSSYYSHLEELKGELDDLIGNNKTLNDKQRERADFINHELSDALGIECQDFEKVIEHYESLEEYIDTLIVKKRIQSMMEAFRPEYEQALKSEASLAEDVGLKYEDAKAQKQAYQDLDKFYADKIAQGFEIDPNAYKELDNARKKADEAETAFLDAIMSYSEVSGSIQKYESAMSAALEGNYDEAEEFLTGSNDLLDKNEAKLEEILREQIDFTGGWLEETENAMAGGGEQAAKNYNNALKDYFAASEERNSTLKEALGFGEDLGNGVAEGLEISGSEIERAVRELVNKHILEAARDEADSHSPSRKMEEFAEDCVDGVPIGIRKKLDEVDSASRDIFNRMAAGMQYNLSSAGNNGNVSYDNRKSSIGNISVYLSGAGTSDPDQLANLIAEKLNDQILNRKAALS